MKFGPVSPKEAIGGVAVHAIRQGDFVLKKGTLITSDDAADLIRVGITEIVVARLEDGDVSEDMAATQIAEAVAGEGVAVERAFTGRSNLFASRAGILMLDSAAIKKLNLVDEAVTFATLPEYRAVAEGEMIGTIKLIPFGIDAKLCAKAVKVAEKVKFHVAPYKLKRVGVVSTLLPGLSPKVIDKTISVTRERLARAGARIVAERRVTHTEAPLARAIVELMAEGAELILVFGASAIADRRDIIPSAVEAVGGAIEHFGMPVDPGNLLLIANAHGVPIIGAPGCARSPKENGFDWVLMRMLAGLQVSRDEITSMGVGGLLMEIVTRPQPRVQGDNEMGHNIAAVILAAGRSTRMGGPNKMLAEINGKPLVRIVAEQALASHASPVLVVTGHERTKVVKALEGLDVQFVYNPDYADGLATSVKAGIGAVPDATDGAIVCLGDMPLVDAGLMNRLIDAFAPERGALIAVPVADGRRGNPVLWSRRLFVELMTLQGDIGARHLIAQHQEAVAEVQVKGMNAFLDVDTPGELAAARDPDVTRSLN